MNSKMRPKVPEKNNLGVAKFQSKQKKSQISPPGDRQASKIRILEEQENAINK